MFYLGSYSLLLIMVLENAADLHGTTLVQGIEYEADPNAIPLGS